MIAAFGEPGYPNAQALANKYTIKALFEKKKKSLNEDSADQDVSQTIPSQRRPKNEANRQLSNNTAALNNRLRMFSPHDPKQILPATATRTTGKHNTAISIDHSDLRRGTLY